jgi:hypothetical protein
MRAAAEATALPFSDHPSDDSKEGRHETTQDWFLALRHARVPFRPEDRLLLLYGHPLVFRLGLHAATERVLAGEPVLYLDGANTFDPFLVARLARAHRRQPRQILTMIHVARAFTCCQMERLVSDCLSAALDRYQARIAILAGFFDTCYGPAIPDQEATRLVGRMLEAISRLTQHGYTLLCLCPPPPILTRTSQRSLDQLRGQADRVIRVQEEQGLVRLEEEGSSDSQSWEIPSTVFAPRSG